MKRMIRTLRTRLLLSYVLVLVVMLLLIGLTLLVFLRSSPLPLGPTTSRLTAVLLDIRAVEIPRLMMPQDELEQRIVTILADEATLRETRLIIMTNDRIVQFDSEEQLVAGAPLDEISHEPLLRRSSTMMHASATLIEGRFYDADGSEWVYVAQPVRPALQQETDSLLLMTAAPVPQPTLREVFNSFGDEFLRPLTRAGLLGLLIAVVLAVFVARSVARPLQHMSLAARRIAEGHFDQRVPVEGPLEVRALADSFNLMVGRVSTSQQAQRDFLANVSHDLRTPLTSIQGFSQAIAEGVASDPAAARSAAQIIYDEAARLHRMVEDLLDLARIEAGRWDMTRHAVGMHDLLHGVTDSLSVKARDKGLRLTANIPPDLPRIAGDADRLAQVFTNLIDNAIKHTPAGGEVTVEAGTRDGGLVVSVRDTGEGIAAEDLARIFERFYQVDKSRKRDPRAGMGLGLAITRQIVEAHGGAIQVASKPRLGTLFTVWLPLPTPDMSTVSLRRF